MGASAFVFLAASLLGAAETAPLVCFGNEPSWSVDLTEPGVARLALPDEGRAEYRGSFSRIEPLGESAWRGKPATGAGGDLVLFLREGECSDGMSDTRHPVNARVSLANGRFLAGCCRVAGQVASAPGLEGRLWRVTDLPGQDVSALAAARPALTVRFEAGHVDGFSGCNRFAGAYTLAGNRVHLGPLAGTMMACTEPAMTLEDRFRSTLAGTLTYAFADDRLTLTSESGATATLRETPAPSLEAILWEVTGYNNGREAVVSPQLGTTLSLSFANGMVVGSSGCNTFRSSYTRDGDRLSIGPAATTRKLCPEEGVMEQEREFLAALEAAKTWIVRDELLDLHFEDGARALTARPK